EARRDANARALDVTLRGPRYLQLVDELRSAATAPQILDRDRPVRELARTPFRRLRRAVRALGDEPADEELHRIRILAKRARYAAELAVPAEGKAAGDFVREAKVFQDLLGEHQDAAVAEDCLRTLAAGADSAAALAAGRLVEVQRLSRERAR